MVKNWKFLLTFVSLLVLVVGWFYWFELRPSNIKSECHKTVFSKFEPNKTELENIKNKNWSTEEIRQQRIREYEEEAKIEFISSDAFVINYNTCLRERGLK